MAMFLNHRPDQFGIWFTYDGNRYKDYYDIRLKSGEVIEDCYPNANAWYQHRGGSGRCYFDKEIAQVRLKPDHELHEYAHQGADRLERNLKMFAGAIPPEPCSFPVKGNEELSDLLNAQGVHECEVCEIFGRHDCPALPDRRWGDDEITGMDLTIRAIMLAKVPTDLPDN